ncbi:MAG: hypothetical protein RLZ69_1299 [Actinomycetota bacterium]
MNSAPRSKPSRATTQKRKPEKSTGPRVEVRSANSPGWTGKVDAAKYEAMRNAILRILPRQAPGLTQTEMRNKAVFHLPAHIFPAGERADWWVKTVYLDLEADGVIEREKQARPLRWHRV